MNTDLNLSELFDRYLENDLNILEIQEFELQLKNDKVFADNFRLHKEVDSALIEDDIFNFRLQLERIGNRNIDLVQAPPMVIAEEMTPEMDKAILEQDIMALRDQLNRIHISVSETVQPLIVSNDLIEIEEAAHNEILNADSKLSVLVQDIDKAIMQEEVMSLRTKLEKIGERTLAGKRNVNVRRRMLTYASTAVAAVFILLVAGTIFLNQEASGSLSVERTFSRHFLSYDGLSNRRGPSEDGKGVVELGIQKYNKGEFDAALEVFEACISDNNATQTVLLYAASSALFVGDPDKGLRYFEKMDANSPYSFEIDWFTAGCFLKKKNFVQAKSILNKIAESPKHDHYKDAIEVLKNLQD
jgi:tetratricopeptide (TPR) repeat protein